MEDSGDFRKIVIDPRKWTRRVLIFCVSSAVAIALMDVFLNHYRWIPSRPLRRSFNITREDSIGNWFSSTLALLVGVILLLIYLQARYQSSSTRRRERVGWAILAASFIVMAIDDATKLHERVGTAFRDLAESRAGADNFVSAFPSYSWQLVLGPVFVILGIYMLWFLWTHLRDRRSRLTFLAAFACLAIAVLMDLVEGMDETIPAMDVHNVEHFMKLGEETLEMLGMTLFLVTFLGKWLGGVGKVQIDVSS